MRVILTLLLLFVLLFSVASSAADQNRETVGYEMLARAWHTDLINEALYATCKELEASLLEHGATGQDVLDSKAISNLYVVCKVWNSSNIVLKSVLLDIKAGRINKSNAKYELGPRLQQKLDEELGH